MNKVQKLIQPLIEAAAATCKLYIHDEEFDGYVRGLGDAFNVLATLTDAITLADVPTVEWQFVAETESRRPHYAHGNYVLYADFDDFGTGEWDAKIKKDRRYEEIRIYLAAIERKLLAELAGVE